jgi:DNA-binding XRE family transcriptional regulator
MAGVTLDEVSPRRPGDPPWRSRTAHRTSTPEAMAALRDGRVGRGWSMSEAARRSGVSRPSISLLERGLRRPSVSVAEDLIAAYGLAGPTAAAIRAIAIPLVGRDSPYKAAPATGRTAKRARA